MTDLMRRLEEIPGVENAAAVQGLPPVRQVNANDTEFEGVPQEPGSPPQNVDFYQTVTPDYFTTLGIKIVEGRGFTPADAGGPPVFIVNEALAKRFYPGKSAIGRRMKPFGIDTVPWATIVGVARDVKQAGLEAEVGTELYFNYEQAPAYVGFAPGQMNVVLKSTRPPGAPGGGAPDDGGGVRRLGDPPAIPLAAPRHLRRGRPGARRRRDVRHPLVHGHAAAPSAMRMPISRRC
jgi:hypothetical protein